MVDSPHTPFYSKDLLIFQGKLARNSPTTWICTLLDPCCCVFLEHVRGNALQWMSSYHSRPNHPIVPAYKCLICSCNMGHEHEEHELLFLSQLVSAEIFRPGLHLWAPGLHRRCWWLRWFLRGICQPHFQRPVKRAKPPTVQCCFNCVTLFDVVVLFFSKWKQHLQYEGLKVCFVSLFRSSFVKTWQPEDSCNRKAMPNM